MTRVYLDNNATTPLDPRVRAAMLPWLGERWGNPSSIHAHGQEAREAVEESRTRVAALLGARPEEIVFVTSGPMEVPCSVGTGFLPPHAKTSRDSKQRASLSLPGRSAYTRASPSAH